MREHFRGAVLIKGGLGDKKAVGNENKILVLGYFGSASKFWARF